MSLFDLLFIALFFAAAGTLLVAGWFAVCGQFARAGRVLRRLLVCAAVYMAVVIGVSLVLPRRLLAQGTRQCFDDWCIAVEGVKQSPEGVAVKYSVDLRLSSRARGVSQRENNLSVYLTDDRDARYDPVAGGAPFNVLLGPGDSVVVNRSFAVPAGTKIRGLVTAHEGGFPIGWFIIGYDTWFRKPALVELLVPKRN